jgi:hypothetical protein
MGQARIKKLKLQREIAAQNPTTSPEELAKLVTAALHSPPTPPKTGLISEVGLIDDHQLRINAIHEAGHAVIMTRIAYGCEVISVDPQEVKRLTGRAMPGFTSPVKKPLEAQVYLRTTLAGITAEAMFATDGRISPTEDDITHAQEILDKMGLSGEDRERQFLTSRMETQQLVSKYKDDIISIAEALIKRLTLSGVEVRALIDNPNPASPTNSANTN